MSTQEQLEIRPGADWQPAGEYEDIRYEIAEGIAKITINRPEVRNAFRPQTLIEVSDAFNRAREDLDVGVIILTGEGPLAFCSGGDQRVRGDTGYMAEDEAAKRGVGRFHVTDLQVQIRRTPKPVIAMVAGYAIGGGHVLHIVCDLTIAADNARFGQTGPRVGSFDGGYGAALLSRLVGPKKAKEIWFLTPAVRRPAGARHGSGQHRRAARAQLEEETVQWCREMLAAVAVRAAAAQGELQRRRGRRSPASSSSRTTRTSSSTSRRRRRRAVTPTSRSASPTSASSPSARERRRVEPAAAVARRRAAADAAGGDRARARRHRAGRRPRTSSSRCGSSAR